MNSRTHFFLLKWLMVLALVGFIGGVAGCKREDSTKPAADNAGSEVRADAAVERPYLGTIMAVGDSLTAGLGVDEEQAYPAQLQRKLEKDGYHYRVINAGVSGETSSGALSRLDWILTARPDIVILETGANDGLRGIDPTVPRKNIDKILGILREHHVVTVLAGMKMVRNLGTIYTSAFNRLYPDLAAGHRVIFMPFFLEGVATVPALNIEDGLHPNIKGYHVVVNNLYPYVIQAIKKLEKERAGRQVK